MGSNDVNTSKLEGLSIGRTSSENFDDSDDGSHSSEGSDTGSDSSEGSNAST